MLVPQKDLPSRHGPSFPFRILATITITSMLPFFLAADFLIWFYQTIYFGINKIPKMKRSTYVVLERYKLGRLTVIQKWSCGYCEYANGIILWLKAVANQTEIYSCAIKYSHPLPGQEYQAKFYDQETFADEKGQEKTV